MPNPSGGGAPSKPRMSRARKLFWLLVLAAWGAFLCWTWYPPRPEIVEEFYSRGIYRAIVTLLTTFTVRTDASVALWLVLAISIGFPLLWAANWIYLRRTGKGSHWRGLFWGLKWAFALTPLALVWFLLFWGAGYQREPVEKRLSLDPVAISGAEAAQLRAMLLAIVQRDLPTDQRDVSRAVAAVSMAMGELAADWDGVPILLPKGVKATPKGLLLVNGTSGVCVPLTLEPHVDGALPEAAFVATAAHELGHIAGICGEAEASLIGYAAGLKAEDPFARYAVALGMYRSLAGKLPQQERQAALELLPEAAREDLRREQEAHRQYRIDWVGKISWKVYNKYLESRGVTEGVRDYARGLTLFAAAWRKGLVQLPAPETVPADAPPAGFPQEEPPGELLGNI
jgi:phage tail protein X